MIGDVVVVETGVVVAVGTGVVVMVGAGARVVVAAGIRVVGSDCGWSWVSAASDAVTTIGRRGWIRDYTQIVKEGEGRIRIKWKARVRGP